jgi:hypothetical protein
MSRAKRADLGSANQAEMFDEGFQGHRRGEDTKCGAGVDADVARQRSRAYPRDPSGLDGDDSYPPWILGVPQTEADKRAGVRHDDLEKAEVKAVDILKILQRTGCIDRFAGLAGNT